MAKTKKTSNKNTIIGGIVAGIVAVGVSVSLIIAAINGNRLPTITIEYGEQKEATITLDSGATEAVDVPTVEYIDTNSQELADEESGRGAYVWVDVSSPDAFRSSTIGRCINTDGYYGAQCWDLGDAFWQNYAGRQLSTCGTGAAKGTLNCYEYNAGGEFDMIWDATQLQPGDWVVFNGGQYGHIGMAMGYYNNGYITLLGQNQGGGDCEQGGAATNIININLRDFSGAFRPKAYVIPEPEPEPEPVIPISGCVEWGVVKGDTMSKIMLECEGTVVYGDAMNAYAATWYSRYVKPGQSVYEGWTTGTGYGLYAGDTIDHRIGE